MERDLIQERYATYLQRDHYILGENFVTVDREIVTYVETH